MSEQQKILLEALKNCVIEMEDEAIIPVAESYISEGYDPFEGIREGLCKGMEHVGELFESEAYYIPELLICSDAMYAGLDVLKRNITDAPASDKRKAVIGVVEGDTHDIGKNIFKIMLEANGFEVIDLGRDVPCETFVETVKTFNPDLVGMSTLMTTTMKSMKRVIDLLTDAKLREDVVVMVGGGPISLGFAKSIGADGYERDAGLAAKLAKKLVDSKVKPA